MTGGPEIPREVLDAWRAPAAPPTLADRIAAAWVADGAEAPPRRALWPYVAAAGLIAAAVVVWLRPAPRENPTLPPTGSLVQAGASLQLPRRTRARVESAAGLGWRDGAAGLAVHQLGGTVLYVVDSGTALTVRAAGSEARVLGTRFAVAADATTLFVAVDAGRVELGNSAGSVSLSAGAAGIAVMGRAPRRLESAAELAALQSQQRSTARENARLVEAVAQLRAKLDALEAAGETEARLLARCRNGGTDCPALDPPPALLAEWARCGTVVHDLAAGLVSDAVVASLDVRPTEQRVIADAAQAIGEEDESSLDALHLEATGRPVPTRTGDMSVFKAIEGALLDGSGVDREAVLVRIARERAGLASPPSNLRAASPYERYIRQRVSAGDRMESRVARHLGERRTREIRAAGGGWSRWPSTYKTERCKEEG